VLTVTAIAAAKKRALLRQILLVGAVTSASTVNAALLDFQTSLNEQSFQRGRQYSSTSGNGQSASYKGGGPWEQWSQENLFAVSEEFFDILALTLSSNAALVDDGQTASTQAIFAAMLYDDRLHTVIRRGLDVTLLGFPQVGQLGGPA
jgi:hypothetical protein